ncbi:MAG: Omp28 family outer membrane lipoprotein [Muribaculaceae bacterium]|nr:Omp28 family outer membrane lipoprotein [Muribaculaceae bacterium]
MRLRNILYIILAMFAVSSCDKIDENNRFEGPIEFKAMKSVLIEDFTGQKCLNCPNAADAIHSMQNIYGAENVVAVALHGGALSMDAPRGLANAESKAYNTQWGVEGYPSGMVDRVGGLIKYPSWSATLVKRLQMTTPITISLNNEYDEATGKIKVVATVNSETAISGMLQLWIVENNIVALQIMPDGTVDMKYVHQHVFRATMNGKDGEKIELIKDTPKEITYTKDLDSAWKAENLAVVAFVYTATGVEQTIAKNIITE